MRGQIAGMLEDDAVGAGYGSDGPRAMGAPKSFEQGSSGT